MVTVYRKTAKGQAEIETRANRLPPRLRNALILVDGRKTDAELCSMLLVEPAALLAKLLADGFIEVLVTVADRPVESKPEAAAPASPPRAAGQSVEAVRRNAVRALHEQLGPASESIAIKIEAARSMPELQPLLAQAAQILAQVRGNAAASAFAARFIETTDG